MTMAYRVWCSDKPEVAMEDNRFIDPERSALHLALLLTVSTFFLKKDIENKQVVVAVAVVGESLSQTRLTTTTVNLKKVSSRFFGTPINREQRHNGYWCMHNRSSGLHPFLPAIHSQRNLIPNSISYFHECSKGILFHHKHLDSGTFPYTLRILFTWYHTLPVVETQSFPQIAFQDSQHQSPYSLPTAYKREHVMASIPLSFHSQLLNRAHRVPSSST